jgi:hypothetical protein
VSRGFDELLAVLGWPRPAFHADAACREHPEVDFFPDVGATATDAKRICAGCLVRAECLEYALAGCERGIWGGTSSRDRRRLRAARRIEALPSLASMLERYAQRGPFTLADAHEAALAAGYNVTAKKVGCEVARIWREGRITRLARGQYGPRAEVAEHAA